MKNNLKNQIRDILSGKLENNVIKIFILDPATGIETLYGQYPNDKNLNITADSVQTAETFKKLRGLT